MITIKLYPEDFRAEGSLAVKLPMNGNRSNSNSGLFNVSYTTEEQAVSNYINLLLTKPAERFMQPVFGIGIQLYLFEQNTDDFHFELDTLIREQTSIWLPYIIVDDLQIINKAFSGTESDTEHGINIVIRFRVTESGANRLIEIYNLNGITVNAA